MEGLVDDLDIATQKIASQTARITSLEGRQKCLEEEVGLSRTATAASEHVAAQRAARITELEASLSTSEALATQRALCIRHLERDKAALEASTAELLAELVPLRAEREQLVGRVAALEAANEQRAAELCAALADIDVLVGEVLLPPSAPPRFCAFHVSSL